MFKSLWYELLTVPKITFVKEYYKECGLSQRVHGNSKKLPHNALCQAVTKDVKNFVTTNKLCERKCCCSSWQNSKLWVVFHPDFLS